MCKGDRVIYFDSRSRSEGPATIEAVHKDPQGGDFFTILLPGGKEKQTERARLRHADVAAPCRPVAYATPVANATCVPPAPPAGAQRVVVRARTVERVEAAERTRVGTVLKVHYLTKSAYEIMKEGHCDGHCFDYMVRRVSPAEVIFTASALTRPAPIHRRPHTALFSSRYTFPGRVRCRESWAVHHLRVRAPELDRKHLPLPGYGTSRVASCSHLHRLGSNALPPSTHAHVYTSGRLASRRRYQSSRFSPAPLLQHTSRCGATRSTLFCALPQ